MILARGAAQLSSQTALQIAAASSLVFGPGLASLHACIAVATSSYGGPANVCWLAKVAATQSVGSLVSDIW